MALVGTADPQERSTTLSINYRSAVNHDEISDIGTFIRLLTGNLSSSFAIKLFFGYDKAAHAFIVTFDY